MTLSEQRIITCKPAVSLAQELEAHQNLLESAVVEQNEHAQNKHPTSLQFTQRFDMLGWACKLVGSHP